MMAGQYDEKSVRASIAELKQHRARLEDIRDSRFRFTGPLYIPDLQQLNSEIRCLHGVEARLEAML